MDSYKKYIESRLSEIIQAFRSNSNLKEKDLVEILRRSENKFIKRNIEIGVVLLYMIFEPHINQKTILKIVTNKLVNNFLKENEELENGRVSKKSNDKVSEKGSDSETPEQTINDLEERRDKWLSRRTTTKDHILHTIRFCTSLRKGFRTVIPPIKQRRDVFLQGQVEFKKIFILNFKCHPESKLSFFDKEKKPLYDLPDIYALESKLFAIDLQEVRNKGICFMQMLKGKEESELIAFNLDL